MNNAHYRPHYPHMLESDIPVWNAFLKAHGGEFTKFAYDVHVGQGIDLGPEWAANIRRDAKALTQKRIDAVGFRNGEIWIIEVKHIAGVSAPGQAIAYKILYDMTLSPTIPTIPVIVFERATPDVIRAAHAMNVRTYEVTPE